jgi:tetratricopeptide (TPR) repeat protein
VILPALAPSSAAESRHAIALVDIEELYAPGLERPSALPAGSPGYAHKTAPEGLWSAPADRFAGAILIAELLGYCDERMCGVAWGESFFAPDEVQRDGARYQIAVTVLRERWGDRVAELFQRAWHSDSLLDCATFGEWQTALPVSRAPISVTPTPPRESPEFDTLLTRARGFERQNNLPDAIATYTAIIARLPEQDALRTELNLILADLQKRQQTQSEAEQAARQADTQMQAERWNDAAQLLKAAIAQFPQSAQAEQWRAALKRCEEERELAALFDHSVEALQRRERMAASELLRQVVHRRPGYTRKGQRAASLLDQSLRAKTPARSPLAWALAIVGTIVVVALCVFGSAYVWLNVLAPTPTRIAFPTIAPTMRAAPPVLLSPTAISRPPTAPPTYTPLPTYTPYPTALPPLTLTPLPQWNIVFQDLFNDSSLDSSKWIVNNPSGDVLLSGSFLRLSSSSNRFPYVYPRNDPFPTRGDFRFVAQFRYVRVDDCGVGVLIMSFLPSPGTSRDVLNSQMQSAEQTGVTAGVWQGIPDDMQIWYRSGNERPSQRVSSYDTASHTMEIQYVGSRYTILLDGRTIFTSSPTSARPHTIWIGHPGALGGPCRWSILEIDAVRVEVLY